MIMMMIIDNSWGFVRNFELISHDAEDSDYPWAFVDSFDLINHGDVDDQKSKRAITTTMATIKDFFRQHFYKSDYFRKSDVYFSSTHPKLSLAKLKVRRKLLTMTLQTIVFIFC